MITMYDSITVPALPSGAAAYAGYVGGDWPTYVKVRARFPKAHVLSIAISASEDAECLDIEKGDATNGQAPAWFRRQLARNVWRPVIYTQQSNLGALAATMTAAGIARPAYRLWSAHYDGLHVCSPHSCDAGATADGTQWTFTALGRNLDQSELDDSFFSPAPVPSEDDNMASSVAYYDNAPYFVCVGTDHCVYYMGPEDKGQWHGIAGSAVKSGVSLAISASGEKTIFYTNTSGVPCKYTAKPGSDTWVWSHLPGAAL